MVLPDWGRAPAPPRIQVTLKDDSPRLASPLVRLAAVIVDVGVVLTPAYVLITSPLKREVTTAMLTGEDGRVALFATLMALVALGLLIAYQTIAHHVFGRTLGKRAFGLRVVTLEGPSTIGAQLTRALVWIAGVGLAGLPFLAVFAHERRRPLHDRAGDTLVIVDDVHASAGVDHPGPTSRRLVRTVYAVAALILVGGGLLNLRDVLAKVDLERELVGQVDQRATRECDVVSENAIENTDDDHARVRLALTLYAAGLADRSCLENEVEREAVMQIPVAPVTDLAQAFVNADDAEVSNAYLDHVCTTGPDGEASAECAMSHLVARWSEGKWDDVGDILARAPAGSGYLDVWGVRHYLKQARYDEALAALDRLLARPEVASFSLIERTKALYAGYRGLEGRVAYRQAMVSLNADEARDLSTWACAQELARGCEALTEVACGVALKADVPERSASPAETLVGLRAAECRGDHAVNYQELAENIEDGDWRDFFRGNSKAQSQDRNAAAALFTKVLASEGSPDLLRVEATRRLTEIASPRQMRALIDSWGDVEARETWVHVGNVIFERLAANGDVELALGVADSLRQDRALSPNGARTLQAMREVPADLRVRAPASARHK